MALKRKNLLETDQVFIKDGNDNVGCGSVNDDGHLYLIDRGKSFVYQLPDEYQNTPIYILPPCGGYSDGLIMVSTMSELELQYHHSCAGAAGMWGWMDLDGHMVIETQFVFAMHFFEGKAIVCKGDWTVDENGRYWCDNEQWGVIDCKGNQIIPCIYDEINKIDNTDSFYLCHKDGWDNGNFVIYDLRTNSEICNLDFYFDCGYMFNECFYDNGLIIFDEHIPGMEQDYIYIYSIVQNKWIAYKEEMEGREMNGETKMTVKTSDGKEIIVF